MFVRQSLKKNLSRLFLVILILLIIIEVLLRTIFGFCDAVLMRSDPDYEYIAIPQKRFRLGNHIYYNSLSQRNNELTPQDSIIILGFGDSVINGGTQTDQDSLATSRLSEFLTKKYSIRYLVTNISANSWGPDNCYAYLKKNGNFRAKGILLVVSSQDAYDDMNFVPVVGKDKDYPKEQYSLAIEELLDRYIIPRLFKKQIDVNTHLDINKQTANIPFNTGFENFKKYSDSTGIPLILYLHAEKNELRAGNYNQQGMQIINYCKKRNIFLIKELDYHLSESAYRDNIHLNNLGQRKMFEILKRFY